MAAVAIEQSYAYPFASELTADGTGHRLLRLATFTTPQQSPHFFKGKLTHPRQTADLLLALSLISRTRYFLAPGMLARILAAADPVVTSGGERLRFEVFSVCGGVYARIDLHPEAVDGDWTGRGTTNVDFNPPMRAALARVGSSDTVGLNVGADRLELERGGSSVVEKKVKLPARWLKGFVEVQAYQYRMRPALELSADELRRFVRSLPRQVASGPPAFAVPAGRGLRLSQRGTAGAIPIGGPARLRAFETLLPHVTRVRVYAGDDGVSGWELHMGAARFHLVLSPEATRGFSGEGQALEDLARDDSRDAVGKIRAALRWQARIAPEALAAETGLPAEVASRSLAVLGSRGLVGFDLGEGYFHRELPFDLELVEALQPRLRDARKLVEQDGVRVVDRGETTAEAYVQGTGVEHRVRTQDDEMRCTCRWFAKNQGARGPCKHILAFQIVLERESD
jgi:hypothetical protein